MVSLNNYRIILFLHIQIVKLNIFSGLIFNIFDILIINLCDGISLKFSMSEMVCSEQFTSLASSILLIHILSLSTLSKFIIKFYLFF